MIASFSELKTDLLVMFFFENEIETRDTDKTTAGIIKSAFQQKEFTGKINQSILIRNNKNINKILLIGLGKRNELNFEKMMNAASIGSSFMIKSKSSNRKIIYSLFNNRKDDKVFEEYIQAISQGADLGLYKFDKYKKDKTREVSINFWGREENRRNANKQIKTGTIISDGVSLARDISNMPSSDCTPLMLASRAKKISNKSGLKCRIIKKDQLKKLGMGGIIGVSKGSHQPPVCIVLEHKGGKKNEKPVVIVGKTITFDSGGISIKPSAAMDEMKHDKSGGAAVLGIMESVSRLKIPMNIIGIMPTTENLPGGNAYKPGDVLTFYNKKTAEILNTDAEGRLVLADALALAQDYKPRAIIDLATLTGACIVALGSVASGMMGNNDALKRMMFNASKACGERIWELPLWPEYKNMIKSDIADIKNIGVGGAGTITAAAFLSNFVGDYPWVHLDIAGTAWKQRGTSQKGYIKNGATGVGVMLIVELLSNWNKYSKLK